VTADTVASARCPGPSLPVYEGLSGPGPNVRGMLGTSNAALIFSV
jgi:hypothetical protein